MFKIYNNLSIFVSTACLQKKKNEKLRKKKLETLYRKSHNEKNNGIGGFRSVEDALL